MLTIKITRETAAELRAHPELHIDLGVGFERNNMVEYTVTEDMYVRLSAVAGPSLDMDRGVRLMIRAYLIEQRGPRKNE